MVRNPKSGVRRSRCFTQSPLSIIWDKHVDKTYSMSSKISHHHPHWRDFLKKFILKHFKQIVHRVKLVLVKDNNIIFPVYYSGFLIIPKVFALTVA